MPRDDMTTPAYLGEFEHLLLLAVLQLGDVAFGADIARELEQRAGRSVSRGHLYTSLDRLEQKGLLRWKIAGGTAVRDGLPRRAYTVTPAGIAALRATRDTLRRMWRGLDGVLNEPAS
jgi:PadR family transcriptional regulator PadR